jgi:hypothetical protein
MVIKETNMEKLRSIPNLVSTFVPKIDNIVAVGAPVVAVKRSRRARAVAPISDLFPLGVARCLKPLEPALIIFRPPVPESLLVGNCVAPLGRTI